MSASIGPTSSSLVPGFIGSLKVIIEAINKSAALDSVTMQIRNEAVDKQLSDKHMYSVDVKENSNFFTVQCLIACMGSKRVICSYTQI